MKICDLCRKREGVRFVDNFWTCIECCCEYMRKVSREGTYNIRGDLKQCPHCGDYAEFKILSGTIHDAKTGDFNYYVGICSACGAAEDVELLDRLWRK
jgi:hypothetical protein